MYIRKATEQDLPWIREIYDAARTFMQEHGNKTQWVGGYPSLECSRKDMEEGVLYVCAEALDGTENGSSAGSEDLSAAAPAGPSPCKAAPLAVPGLEGTGDCVLAVFVFAVGEDPTYRYIEDGAWLNDEPYGVIHRIAVSDQARGKGAAAFCMEWAAGQIRNLRIDTHEDNIPMQKLIQKCGFIKTGRIYTEDGTPRIAFQKITGKA